MRRPLLPTGLLICLLSTAPTLHAQDSGTIYYDKQWRECAKDTAYYHRSYERIDDSLFAIESRYRWGVLEMEGNMLGRKYGAVKIGSFKFYHETGALKSMVNYVRGEEEGEYRKWYANGKLALKGQYGIGRRVGVFTSWYSDGNLEYEGGYRNDQKHGPWTYWHPNAAIRAKGAFDRDVETGHWEWFYEEGEKEGVGEYDPITAKGERTWYDRSGKVCAREKILESEVIEGTYIDATGAEHHDIKAAYRKPMPVSVDDVDRIEKFFAGRVEYPEDLPGPKRPGLVVLSVTIDRTGAIAGMNVELSTNAALEPAARAAVEAVEWRPGLRHGTPGLDWVFVPITFRP